MNYARTAEWTSIRVHSVLACMWAPLCALFIQRLVLLTLHCSFLGLVSVIPGLRSGGGQCWQVGGNAGGGDGGLPWLLPTYITASVLSDGLSRRGIPRAIWRLRHPERLPCTTSLCGKGQTCSTQGEPADSFICVLSQTVAQRWPRPMHG